MTPADIRDFILSTCKHASRQGIKLRLDETSRGFEWEWSNMPGLIGQTTARTKPVALLNACESFYQTATL